MLPEGYFGEGHVLKTVSCFSVQSIGSYLMILSNIYS